MSIRLLLIHLSKRKIGTLKTDKIERDEIIQTLKLHSSQVSFSNVTNIAIPMKTYIQLIETSALKNKKRQPGF